MTPLIAVEVEVAVVTIITAIATRRVELVEVVVVHV
jgi:hypothetical protein